MYSVELSGRRNLPFRLGQSGFTDESFVFDTLPDMQHEYGWHEGIHGVLWHAWLVDLINGLATSVRLITSSVQGHRVLSVFARARLVEALAYDDEC